MQLAFIGLIAYFPAAVGKGLQNTINLLRFIGQQDAAKTCAFNPTNLVFKSNRNNKLPIHPYEANWAPNWTMICHLCKTFLLLHLLNPIIPLCKKVTMLAGMTNLQSGLHWPKTEFHTRLSCWKCMLLCTWATCTILNPTKCAVVIGDLHQVIPQCKLGLYHPPYHWHPNMDLLQQYQAFLSGLF